MICPKQTPMKSTNISSAIGRRPDAAAPSAAPMMAVSEIGVSMTRSGNFLCRPAVDWKTPPILPTSSPMQMTRGSRSISCWMPSTIAWKSGLLRILTSRHDARLLEHVLEGFRGGRVVALPRERDGGLDARLGAAADLGRRRVVNSAICLQARFIGGERILPAQRLDLALRPIRLGVALEVPVEAIDLDLEQRRPFAARARARPPRPPPRTPGRRRSR